MCDNRGVHNTMTTCIIHTSSLYTNRCSFAHKTHAVDAVHHLHTLCTPSTHPLDALYTPSTHATPHPHTQSACQHSATLSLHMLLEAWNLYVGRQSEGGEGGEEEVAQSPVQYKITPLQKVVLKKGGMWGEFGWGCGGNGVNGERVRKGVCMGFVQLSV